MLEHFVDLWIDGLIEKGSKWFSIDDFQLSDFNQN